ncbi:hypothetical protein [Streptomyces sp. NPDC127190]|uniref:hypothetical protein n=1 Tax=unclassified Streptomyces TaxID=2593676 RepID=UPI00363AE6CA
MTLVRCAASPCQASDILISTTRQNIGNLAVAAFGGIRRLLALPLLGSGYLAYLAALFWPAIIARATAMSNLLLSVIGLVTLGSMLSTLYVVSLFLPASTKLGSRTAQRAAPKARASAPATPDSASAK